MAIKAFFVNEKTGREYEVVALDKEAGRVSLKGEFSVFDDEYSKERFQALGYKLVKKDVPDAPAEVDEDDE